MIMKKQYHFLVFLLLLITTIGINKLSAQTVPTFEQTVDYIISNTKGRVMYPGPLDAYSRVNGYKLKDIVIEKNGRIKFITEQRNDYNDFTIIFNVFDLVASTEYPEGVIAKDFLVHFNGLNVTSGYGIVYATQNDALKVARAFRHLRTVCKKPEIDLFSQPITEEKKTLSKAETIRYINKHILTGAKFGLNCNECHEMSYFDNGKITKKYIGFSEYKISTHELQSPSKYVIRAEGGQCVKEDDYGVVWGTEGACVSGLDITCNFDLLKLIGFEIIKVSDEERRYFSDKTSFLKLNFEDASVSASIYLPNINYNKPNFIWTSNSITFNILTENIEKTKKAFMHLEKLIKEEKKKEKEDDPFGN